MQRQQTPGCCSKPKRRCLSRFSFRDSPKGHDALMAASTTAAVRLKQVNALLRKLRRTSHDFLHNPSRSSWAELPDPVRYRLERLAGSRLSQDGVLFLVADRHRSQMRNREYTREHLIDLIREAAAPSPPPRRPTKGSKERRLEGKATRSEVKKMRGNVND